MLSSERKLRRIDLSNPSDLSYLSDLGDQKDLIPLPDPIRYLNSNLIAGLCLFHILMIDLH